MWLMAILLDSTGLSFPYARSPILIAFINFLPASYLEFFPSF